MSSLPASRYHRRVRLLAASILLAATAGCASAGAPLPLRPSPMTLAPGSPLRSLTLSDGDAWLRHYLMAGAHDSALHVLRRSAARPRDNLLRALQEGLVHHHAGRFVESNRSFEWAEQEADRRYTRSVMRGIGSLLINDRVLAYVPSPGELALIPYYRMLNYLAIGRLESAVVEARKSSAYVARLEPRQREACAGFGMTQYMAGLVYEMAGERNDALVSLRNAERSFAACPRGSVPDGFPADLHRAATALGLQDVADSVLARYAFTPGEHSPDEADLIVFIEHGYAAHRAQQDLLLPILAEEAAGVAGGESASAIAAAGRISARVTAMLSGPDAHHLWESRVWNPAVPTSGGSSPEDRVSVAYVLRLAWPVMRLEASRPRAARLIVDGSPFEAPVLEDVSGRLVRDLESRRASILTRTVARGLIKYAATRGAEDTAEDKGGELLGAIVGLVANTAGNALEQADTRSWSLLPDQIAMVRLRVPAGERSVRIQLLDDGGGSAGVLDLGTVELRPGERRFLSLRAWGTEAGDRDRLMTLGLHSLEAVPSPDASASSSTPRRGSRARGAPPPAIPWVTEVPPRALPPGAPVGIPH